MASLRSGADTMVANKVEIFTHCDDDEHYVLDTFHGYLQPLRDLVKEWFHLLIVMHLLRARRCRL
jgi:hypothetical protein